jgi:uncharacterized Ntn-hydrolase superfamily protein
MTFTILGRCEATGALGLAIASAAPAAAARSAHARAGVGVVATQNVTDPRLGPRALEVLYAGLPARETIDSVLFGYRHAGYRQLAVLDARGRTAVHNGAFALPLAAAAEAENAIALGSGLADEGVAEAALAAFRSKAGHLPGRLLAALGAGLDAGGTAEPLRSAGLLVVKDVAFPVVDLRVDWSEDPVGALETIWAVYAPRVDLHVAEALDPAAALAAAAGER